MADPIITKYKKIELVFSSKLAFSKMHKFLHVAILD